MSTEELYVCENCGNKCGVDELKTLVGRIRDRVSAGELMPAGECAKCGAACHDQHAGAVFIEIRGGLVANITSTLPGVQAYVIDYDNVECEVDEESEANLALLKDLQDRLRSVAW